MPNEHLNYPKFDDAGWKGFHEANRKALNEGEIADRWLADNPLKRLDDFKLLARRDSSPNSPPPTPAEVNFNDFRAVTENASTRRTDFAMTEAATFQAIIDKELKNSRFVTVPRDASDIYGKLVPRRLTDAELAALPAGRVLSDRSPWEAALDALGRLGLPPDDPNFDRVFKDTQLRLRRGAGNPVSELDAFLKAAEIAVGDAGINWDTLTYKSLAESLHAELQKWQTLMTSTAEPQGQEMATCAAVCAQRLVELANECAGSTGRGSRVLAFTSLNGLAMLMAIGERMAAQIASRSSGPTIRTLYDRLIEIPNRWSADTPVPGNKYDKGYKDLATVWSADFNGKGLTNEKNFAIACEKRWKPITGQLKNWDALMKNPNNLLNQNTLGQLKSVVNNAAYELAGLRRFVEDAKPTKEVPVVFKEKCNDLLRSIDTLAAHLQSRLALYIKLGT
jgi:hypothetical protein